MLVTIEDGIKAKSKQIVTVWGKSGWERINEKPGFTKDIPLNSNRRGGGTMHEGNFVPKRDRASVQRIKWNQFGWNTEYTVKQTN